jgi:4-amino-4-deoxy-L-arabinose transferase-like glycosyltransferase
LFAALALAKEPVWDGHYYHYGAQRIADGLGYSEDVIIAGVKHWKPWCHYPVGYSAFLGGLYKLFGQGVYVAPIANAVVGALTAVVVHRTARYFLPLWRARAAAVLCALHPGLVLYAALVMTEGLGAFSLLLAGLIALRLRHSKRGIVLSGVVFGLSALVRPTALLAIPLLFWVNSGSWRTKGLRTVATGLVALATIAPWTARNCAVMDGCALISTNGGWNLAIGALTDTGRFTTLRGTDGCRDVTGQVDQDKCWGRVGRQLILADPLGWLQRIPKKLEQTYNHESFAVGYLAQAQPELWPEARRNQWRSAVTIFHHLLMLAAVLGTVAWVVPASLKELRARCASCGFWVQGLMFLAIAGFYTYGMSGYDYPLYWAIALCPVLALLRLPGHPYVNGAARWAWGLVVVTSVTHAIFFGEDRYHLIISPVLCVLAAGMLRTSTTKPQAAMQ